MAIIQTATRSRRIVSLFDESGNAVIDWAASGFECFCFDIASEERTETIGAGKIHFIREDLSKNPLSVVRDISPLMISGFPPCTDLAVSGARHFEKKRAEDPQFQEKAVALCRVVESIGEHLQVPWYLENPVSVLSTLWRKPDFYFHPYEFGGYLPEDDVHPRFPEFIAPRDAYPKKTGIWHSKDFVVPTKKPVEPEPGLSRQHLKLGGNGAKTKRIRSETPRGWARAVFLANHGRFQ